MARFSSTDYDESGQHLDPVSARCPTSGRSEELLTRSIDVDDVRANLHPAGAYGADGEASLTDNPGYRDSRVIECRFGPSSYPSYCLGKPSDRAARSTFGSADGRPPWNGLLYHAM